MRCPMFPLSRRQMLRAAGTGFGYLALADLLAHATPGVHTPGSPGGDNPLSPKAGHHPAKAKSVIFLFMHGGVSQVDSFDHKPLLDKMDGQELPFEPAKGTTVS